VTVRLALTAEFTDVGALTVAAYGPHGVGDDYTHELADAESRARHATLLVAESQGRLLGTVTLVLDDGRYADLTRGTNRVGGDAEFRMLAVRPDARGLGVGEALVRACLEAAREAARRRMLLCTQPDMTSAQALYTRLGCTRAPTLDWQPTPGLTLLGYWIELTTKPSA
jgi:ribosomal protein S18 acetylase RimI-like enzyme